MTDRKVFDGFLQFPTTNTDKMKRSTNVKDAGFMNKPMGTPATSEIAGGVIGAAKMAARDAANFFVDDGFVKDDIYTGASAGLEELIAGGPEGEAWQTNPIVVELKDMKGTIGAESIAAKKKAREEMLKKIDPTGSIQKVGEFGDTGGNEWDELVEQFGTSSGGDLNTAVTTGVTKDADAEASRKALGDKVGLPAGAIAGREEEITQGLRAEEIKKAVEPAPSLTDLMKDPYFASIAQDSVEKLAGIEQDLDEAKPGTASWLEVGAGIIESAGPSFKQSIAGILGAASENQDIGMAILDQRPMGSFGIDKLIPEKEDLEGRLHEDAKAMAIDAYEALKAAHPEMGDSMAKQFAFDVSLALVQMVPTLAVTFATASPGLGAMTMGGQVFGSKYAETRYIEGQTNSQAMQDAAFWATAEAIPEMLPLSALLKGGKFIGADLLKTMGLEGVTEMMTEVLQQGYDVEVHGKDMTWGQFTKEVLYAGAVGAVMGGTMYGGTAPFRSYKETRQQKAQEATESADRINKVVERAASTGLAQRDPEAAAAHVAKVLNDRNQEIIIDVEGAEGALGEEATALFQASGWSEAAIAQERALGGSLTISNEDYAKWALANPEMAVELNKHKRDDHDAMTAKEAEEFEAEKEELDKIEDEAEEEAEEDTDAKAPAEAAGKPKSKWLPSNPLPAEKAAEIAEDQLGMEALYGSAEEAGIPKEKYTEYLAAVQKAKDAGVTRKEMLRLKEKARELTDNWKARRAEVEARMKEHISQQPVHQAVHGIGHTRLDREAVVAIIGEEGLAKLPKQGKRAIVTNKGEAGGLDPHMWAELHGFEGADIMLFAMMDNPLFTQAVQQATDALMMREGGDLSAAHKEVRLAMEGLANSAAAEVLALELSLLKLDKKGGRMSTQKVTAAARERIKSYKLKEATPKRFFAAARRAGKLAGKIVRGRGLRKKGQPTASYDRGKAYKAKFQQLLNFQMAREAYKVQAYIEKQGAKLKKLANPRNKKVQSLPRAYQDALKGLFDLYRMDKNIGPRKGFDFNAWNSNRVANGEKAVEFPTSVLSATTVKFVDSLTVGEFQDLVEAAKAIYDAGAENNKLYNEKLAAGKKEGAHQIRELVNNNLKNRPPLFTREKWKKMKAIGYAFTQLFVNTDTVLHKIDGELWGTTYRLIKRPIDLSMTHGYLPGKRGFLRRRAEFADKVKALADKHFPGRKWFDMIEKPLHIAGVSKPITMEVALTVILNSGSASNIQALMDTGQWTMLEVQAIRDHLTKNELDYAQGVFDLIGEFWPEIKETQERRHERLGEKIEGEAFDTKHGRYRGGYYPLEYQSDRSVDYDPTPVAELIEAGLRPGTHLRTSTADGFTKQRKGSGGKPIRHNLGVFVRHGHRVLYDLEVGDAIADAWGIWNHKDNQATFKETGNDPTYEYIKMFLENMITGEIHLPDFLNRVARGAKAGLTIGKLGFNIKTMAMQPLGLFNSMALVGPRSAYLGVKALLSSNPVKLLNWINEDPLMEQRDSNWNENVQEAMRMMADPTFMKKYAGNAPEFAVKMSFLGIKKLQKMADNLTYLMGFEQGMRKFNGDEAKAREWAGRVVTRSQGSGNFNERTPLERGVHKRGMEQSDVIRAMSPMINFFAAKYSIMVQQAQGKKPTPLHVAKVFAIWTAMIVPEAIATVAFTRFWKALLDGTWDDDDEDLDEEQIAANRAAFWWDVAKQSGGGATGGLPLVRDAWGSMSGFATGGAMGSLAEDTGRFVASMWDLLSEGKVDKTLWNNTVDMLGYIGLPSSVFNQYIPAGYRNIRGPVDEEEQNFFDMMMNVEQE